MSPDQGKKATRRVKASRGACCGGCLGGLGKRNVNIERCVKGMRGTLVTDCGKGAVRNGVGGFGLLVAD